LRGEEGKRRMGSEAGEKHSISIRRVIIQSAGSQIRETEGKSSVEEALAACSRKK